jgi:hypothetical protein
MRQGTQVQIIRGEIACRAFARSADLGPPGVSAR